jgi:hypothetical protein
MHAKANRVILCKAYQNNLTGFLNALQDYPRKYGITDEEIKKHGL